MNPEDLVTMNADAASPGVSVDNSYSEPSSSRHRQSLVSGERRSPGLRIGMWALQFAQILISTD